MDVLMDFGLKMLVIGLVGVFFVLALIAFVTEVLKRVMLKRFGARSATHG